MITTVNLSYSVSGQTITPVQESPYLLASNTVKYVKAQFALDENWASCDSVKAVWSGINSRIVTLLDPDGICYVPHELLAKQQKVYVNLTGSDFEEDTLIDRITTYPLYALNVNATAYTDGSETAPITPSQFEQFVEAVKDEVGKIKDIDSVELNADYTLTISFSDGTETTVGPIRGEQGETGNGIASAVLNDDYTLTLTFTDGTSYTTPSIRGEQGEQGEPGEVTLAQLSAVLPTDTASGAIASFSDGSDLFDYLSCVVNINPVQSGSGTPSPDNVRPITGWTGCEVDVRGFNLWDEVWEVGTINNQGQPIDYANYFRSKNFIPIAPNTTYYQYSGTNDLIYRDFYDYEKNYISVSYGLNGTFTTPKNACYMKLVDVGRNSYNHDISINYPSTDTTYHAHNPNSAVYPISWQTEAGTVYGGTVDLVSGVLTVMGAKDTYDQQASIGVDSDLGGYHRFYISNDNIKKYTDYTSHMKANLCPTVNNYAYYGGFDGEMAVTAYSIMGNQSNWLYIISKTISTVADLKTFLTSNPLEVWYELATSQTYQLTGQQIACLLGQNNVWADCGDTSVTYKADVQRWVEKMLGQ